MNITELIKELQIPSTITRKDYPKVVWTDVDGNAFSVMGTASKAWKSVDRGVASRISSVCMQGDYDTLLAICTTICPMGNTDGDDEWLNELDQEEEEKYAE